MILKNKLCITDPTELAREEKISKRKAVELFQDGLLDTFEIGKLSGLAKIHKYLFDEIYDFAGKIRKIYRKGIDASYHYEGYNIFKAEELDCYAQRNKN